MAGENTDSLEEIKGSSFREAKEERVTALVDLVQSGSSERLCVLIKE